MELVNDTVSTPPVSRRDITNSSGQE